MVFRAMAVAISPSPSIEELDDRVVAARAAGLRYVADSSPGIRRKRSGAGFSYQMPDGELVRQKERLNRIRALAIPPAWTDVWICPSPLGHIQATGRDAKGRKQYRYHQRWREVRDETKYGRMIDFGRALPRLRERVEHDLSLPGMPREKIVATVVRLLDSSYIRVGNTEYARDNASFGLTTMRQDHVDVRGHDIRFKFNGKSGREHEIKVTDRKLAAIVRHCEELPGQELFRYLDEDGEPRTVESSDVNDYLRDTTGDDFTAKDFRTWAGTVLAACALAGIGPAESATEAKRNLVEAVKSVAAKLGNTQAVCRKCYVHPAVIESYLAGRMIDTCRQPDHECERAVLRLLVERAKAA
jgi:DNA topoisomerase I